MKRTPAKRGAVGRAGAKRKTAGRRAAKRAAPAADTASGEVTQYLEEVSAHTETGPPLTGGDLDADWQRAWSSGEEAVGGSVATPDQDIVDELGRALGVEQPPMAPVRMSADILRERDEGYWRLARRAERKGKGQ